MNDITVSAYGSSEMLMVRPEDWEKLLAHVADVEAAVERLQTGIKALEKAHRQQLTAAEEQLAEMRDVLEEADRFLGRIFMGEPEILELHDAIAKALSAAPKRGLVLLHERVDLMDYAPSHETFMYGGGPGGPECKSGEYMGAIRKRLLENPQVGVIVEGFTVTVREDE